MLLEVVFHGPEIGGGSTALRDEGRGDQINNL